MRYAAFLVTCLAVSAAPAMAQEQITIHPRPNAPTQAPTANGGLEITIPPINNPNYLDYGPLPDKPGSDKSNDYANQAGGNDPIGSGPGSDVDADILPDQDGAYDE